MTTIASDRADPKIIPMLGNESLYVGIDIGKQRHVAGFLSNTLLKRHGRFEACPALTFDQSREGFRQLIDRMCTFCSLEQCFALMEKTGHYHKALEQYLLELDIPVYLIHVQERPPGMIKTDKRDALMLANHLYNQLEKGIQVADKTQLVRRLFPPSEAAAQLKGMVHHHYELSQESARRKNKLISISEELFPELTVIYKDPTLPSVLALREKFPTPHAIATASMAALCEVRKGNYPSEEKLLRLQQLAAQTIGTKDVIRQRALVFEQAQLITELTLIREHLQQLETEICQIVEQSREGKILLSLPPMGHIMAATIIATIGTIANFEKASELKSYFGWSPVLAQSGTTVDQVKLTHGGTRMMKLMMYMMVLRAIRMDCEWSRLYERLVPKKCSYDERTRRYKGKIKVIGRIAGQIISLIFKLLKTDQEVLSKVPPGSTPPEPQLYDLAVHKSHCEGHYQSSKPKKELGKIIQLPRM